MDHISNINNTTNNSQALKQILVRVFSFFPSPPKHFIHKALEVGPICYDVIQFYVEELTNVTFQNLLNFLSLETISL